MHTWLSLVSSLARISLIWCLVHMLLANRLMKPTASSSHMQDPRGMPTRPSSLFYRGKFSHLHVDVSCDSVPQACGICQFQDCSPMDPPRWSRTVWTSQSHFICSLDYLMSSSGQPAWPISLAAHAGLARTSLHAVLLKAHSTLFRDS